MKLRFIIAVIVEFVEDIRAAKKVIALYIISILIIAVAIYNLWQPAQHAMWRYKAKRNPEKYDACVMCHTIYPHKKMTPVLDNYVCRDEGDETYTNNCAYLYLWKDIMERASENQL